MLSTGTACFTRLCCCHVRIVYGEHVLEDLQRVTVETVCPEPGELRHGHSFQLESFCGSRKHDTTYSSFESEHVLTARMA